MINNFFFNLYNIESTKWARAQFFAQVFSPFQTKINHIYGWMNFFLILSSVLPTKFYIKILIFETILFHLIMGCLP